MLGTLVRKSLRDRPRAFVGWSVGVALLVLLESALWPSVRNMPAMDQLMKSYPEAMRKLFNLDTLATGSGFINAELFSIVLPVVFLIFAIGRGARAIAGEEEAGTLEVLLITPVSPTRLLLAHAVSLVLAVGALGVVLFVVMFGFSAVFGLGIGAASLASATLAMVLLGIEFGWLALAVGAATGHRAVAIAVTATLAMAAYVLHVAGALVDSVRPWQPISPFHQALAGGPLGGGLRLAYLWLPLVGAVAVALAAPVFDRRDINIA